MKKKKLNTEKLLKRRIALLEDQVVKLEAQIDHKFTAELALEFEKQFGEKKTGLTIEGAWELVSTTPAIYDGIRLPWLEEQYKDPFLNSIS